MKKLLFAGMLSLAAMAMASTQASAWFGCCGGNGKCCTVLCIRQYNAFSPICSGCVTCNGCVPLCCQQPCGYPPYPPPAYPAPYYGYDNGCCAPACGAPSSCGTLPTTTYGPCTTPAQGAPVYAPAPGQPLPGGPAAMMTPAYYPPVQAAGYYGYPARPMPYGYNPMMAPMMR
jgi:hypothetical protein